MQIFETHTSLLREINTSLLSLNEEAAHFENFNDLTVVESLKEDIHV